MARGLNQFAVGTLTDATKVTGTSSTPPGNDRVIQVRLTTLALRNRAQPFSYNVVSQTIRQVESASGGTGVNTRYVVYKATKDCVLDAVTVHVREALTTTVFPEVTIDGYLQKDPYAANSSSNTFDPNVNGETVVIVPEQKLQTLNNAVMVSKNNKLPNGIFPLPVTNQFIEAGRWFVLRFVPPAWNGSSAEGIKTATITLRFAEFHTS